MKLMHTKFVRSLGGFSISLAALLGMMACSDKTQVASQLKGQSFTQSLNPPVLDMLWVLDSRSQFYNAPGRANILSEAQNFFKRLDGSTDSYQIGFITADMLVARGQLQPRSKPLILTKDLGTIDQRVSLFSSLLTQVAFNGQTSGVNQGFQAADVALTQYFQPRKKVPLVLVFISDSDDRSSVPSGSQSAVSYYSNRFLSLKDNDPSLLHVYSINYMALQSGQSISATNRCVTLYNADIDRAGFQDRFFSLANQLAGSTGDICSSFSSQISLEGIRLLTLPSSFALSSAAQPKSIQVEVSWNGQIVNNLTWTYDATTHSIQFNRAPEGGSVISVSYLPL